MSADRHLLFGLLALQNEFIDKRQLVAAFGNWIADHSTPLDEILVHLKAIKEEDRALLLRLVERHVAAQNGDVAASLRSLKSDAAIQEELNKIADRDVTMSIAKLRPLVQNTIMPSVGQATSTGQRFLFLRPLDRGGLGVVSVALDKELNREVALKEIRTECADEPAYRSKFMLEAEVTGGLEHPGIVPVYGFGKGPDGRPFYAMRLINGDNLHVHIKRFHESVEAKKEPFDGPALRSLLRRFLDVCEAIDYAHSRGVLHRDLKPGNIMLGRYGETLVVDWGLAKPQGVQKLESTVSGRATSPETSLVPSSWDEGMTMQGSMVGTAPYAPPEQLSGDLSQVNERSDIYGLGAILYELLTSRVPARFKTLEETIRAVTSGDIKAPRFYQPLVPKPLDAICLRAIAKRPENRYATAGELRQEIERWLDDLPVIAYPEPWRLRSKRWIRRHQSIVATISATVLMATIGLGLFSVIVRRNNWNLMVLNSKLDEQKTVAQNYKEDAVNRYSIAKGAIDTGLIGISESLRNVPGADRLQKQVLQQAANDFERLSKNRSDDPELELERVRALVRLADIYHLQNNTDEAHSKYRESLSVVDAAMKSFSLTDTPPDTLLPIQIEGGKIHARIGLALDIENQFVEARDEFKTAEETFHSLIARFPNSNVCKSSLARMLINKASLIDRMDGAKEALPIYNESLALFDSLQPSDSATEARAIAQCHEGRGRILRKLGRYDESREAYESSREIISQQLAKVSDDTDTLLDLASLHISKANLSRSIGYFDAALTDVESAAKIYTQLRSNFPDDIQIKELWARNETNISAILLDLGNPTAAKSRAFSATQAFKELEISFPQIPSYRQGLATAICLVAQSSMELEPASEDIDLAYQSSIELCENLASELGQADAGVSYYQLLAANFQVQYARYLHLKGNLSESRQLFEKALRIIEQAGALTADDQETKNLVAHTYFRWGLLEKDDHHPTEALVFFSKAIELWRARCNESPSPENRYQLAYCMARSFEATLLNPVEVLKLLEGTDKAPLQNLAHANLLSDGYVQNKNVGSSRRILDDVLKARGNWNADDYCVLAKIQSLEGKEDDARESLRLASEWAAEHRPYHDDVKRLILNTNQTLFPGNAN